MANNKPHDVAWIHQVAWQQALLRLAQRAGKKVLALYHDYDGALVRKKDHSPLTEADRASHALLVQGLLTLAPHIPIISEEGCAGPGEHPAGLYWLVDPLDGTKEFIHRNGQFTINIALIHQGQPVWGVVDVPALGLTYMGGPQLGAWKLVGDKRQKLHVAPWQTPCRIAVSRHHAHTATQRYIARWAPYTLVRLGSALKLCMVAEGVLDLYPRLGPTYAWDTRGAAGVVCQLDGTPILYSNKALLNPYFIVCAQDALSHVLASTP